MEKAVHPVKKILKKLQRLDYSYHLVLRSQQVQVQVQVQVRTMNPLIAQNISFGQNPNPFKIDYAFHE